jgi:signal transduction histidine kinase
VPHRSDLLPAALAAAGSVALLYANLPGAAGKDVHDPDALGVAICVVVCSAIAIRRRFPLGAALLALATFGPGMALGYSLIVPGVTTLWLSGHGALHTGRAATVLLSVWGGTILAIAAATLPEPGHTLRAIGGFALGVLPAAIGDAMRTERSRTREAREHARRIEELRDRDVERAVTEERLRIARDMHDITGHHLSAIALQAAGAGRTTRDEGAQAAFDRIHGLTAEALGQTRRALGVLRESGPATRVPTPRLEHVDQLLEPARAAGLAVELQRDGQARPLSDEIEVCAYRVVQESLTNVVRHAGAAAVQVRLDYGPDELRVAVLDDGVGAPEHGPGGGIEGMRERVTIVGGSFDAGPQPDRRGWAVRARLPLGAGV